VATLPSGTLTFLMTDVEASTRRWEREPDEMRQAMAQHDELFDAAINEFSGINIKPRGEGDSRFAVFQRATDAVCAAADVQYAFCNATWPTASPVRVRMAIHTGEADLIDGDYYGSTVNRCARLRSLAHGGQTLVSLATAQHVRDRLPERVQLRDLGEHRLKDLSLPEHVYQLDVAGVENSFPPLQSLDRHPTNLPTQATPLVGREHETEIIHDWLIDPDTRIVTLTGPGGAGKTRLGLQVAASLVDEFPDGVFFVPLEAVTDPDLVVLSIAQAVGVRESGETSLAEDVSQHLSDKTMLLLLDNFDQLVSGAGRLSELLSVAPNLKMLVTSRVLLSVRGEREYPVPPLGLPPGERMPPFERLMDYDAIRLFVARAKDAQADFTLTRENAAAVVAICRKLDGLPLAIELAAARIRMFPPVSLLKRLERRLSLLTGGARDLPQRQQALRDTIAWSYDLLDEPEQQLFRRMAVFNGGFTIDAAIAVSESEEAGAADPFGGFDDLMLDPMPGDEFGGWDSAVDTVEGLEGLVNKSLLRREQSLDPDDDPRFAMLQTIREFGLEQLNAAGELADIRDRHARHYLEVAELARPELDGPNQGQCIRHLENEHGNFRAAMAFALQTKDGELGMRLAGALWPFWELRSYLTEGRNWTERMLALEGEPKLRVEVLNGVGTMALLLGDYGAAADYHSQALALYKQIGDENGIAFATTNLGVQAAIAGELGKATQLFEDSLERYRALESEVGIADVLSNLGVLLTYAGNLKHARAVLEESLQLRELQGDKSRMVEVLYNLAEVDYHEQLFHKAAERYFESLILLREVDSPARSTMVFAALGAVALARGDLERGTRLIGVSDSMVDETGMLLDPQEQERLEKTRKELRDRLGDEVFDREREEGAKLTFTEAVDYALQARQTSGKAGDQEQHPARDVVDVHRTADLSVG
jgi:predicted ATPase/class 3 adenylate cyclase